MSLQRNTALEILQGIYSRVLLYINLNIIKINIKKKS